MKLYFSLLVLILGSISGITAQVLKNTDVYIVHKTSLSSNLRLYYKNKNNKAYRTLKNLRDQLSENGDSLVFAMNAGMFTKEGKPLGLYIENGKVIQPLNTVQKAYGNFYLQPNGIFYLTADGNAHVQQTKDFKLSDDITFATQSGPMLLIDGEIHKAFREKSSNLNIRNGVGILPDGSMLFVMTKYPVNLYTFADFFKQFGCKNALYLDGAISQTYAPSENWLQTGGPFGVMIGETVPK
ncbi:Uncharacterized protein YigE, DUF2233 family [Pustulibacterium marinum]|uniref:Uncharacterized protein YigE, DUF2233 family n=1 Tax=Pustulibacterium marinum TaxID=1224947 RepID=A0A1I7GWN8_9FLAO|nr:phosphodiester glycosidase family protein [Pustulibacterium marinum]SFU52853.1 Uncharacterized protein YigE, DUF2233 family [Pustulibacterium marinum]